MITIIILLKKFAVSINTGNDNLPYFLDLYYYFINYSKKYIVSMKCLFQKKRINKQLHASKFLYNEYLRLLFNTHAIKILYFKNQLCTDVENMGLHCYQCFVQFASEAGESLFFGTLSLRTVELVLQYLTQLMRGKCLLNIQYNGSNRRLRFYERILCNFFAKKS